MCSIWRCSWPSQTSMKPMPAPWLESSSVTTSTPCGWLVHQQETVPSSTPACTFLLPDFKSVSQG
jgi:hypothetical protein